jgi:sugar (pentulose or hexulose) kinase
MSEQVLCVDLGSTFTKAALVDVADGALLATAARPTTLHTDVLEGIDACAAALGSVGAATCAFWRARRPAAGCGSRSWATSAS